MGRLCDNLDLGALGLDAGESRSLDLGIRIDPFQSGGLRCKVVSKHVASKLTVSRTVHGWAFKLIYVADVSGPCSRCLNNASAPVEVVAREVDQPDEDEELNSPYVKDEHLDLEGWAQDALMLAMPIKRLCREDCRGLCSVCGVDLNESDPADHQHGDDSDPRWAKLKQIKFE